MEHRLVALAGKRAEEAEEAREAMEAPAAAADYSAEAADAAARPSAQVAGRTVAARAVATAAWMAVKEGVLEGRLVATA